MVVTGRKTRYAYLAIMEWQEAEPVFVGVDKVDLECQNQEAAVAGSIIYGPNVVGGEAFFVPSCSNTADCDGEWLLHAVLCMRCACWGRSVSIANTHRESSFSLRRHARQSFMKCYMHDAPCGWWSCF